MGHVTYVERSEAAEAIRPIYDQVPTQLGAMLNMFKALAHNPDLLQGFMALNRGLGKSQLPARLRELAFLKASQLNGCDYCLHYHAKSGVKSGLSDEQIQNLADPESSAFDPLEKTILKFSEQVTKHSRANDSVIAALKETLSDREVVELTATVALANFTNRVNEALAIELP